MSDQEIRQTSLMFNKADLEAGMDILEMMEALPSRQIANETAEPGLAFRLPEFSRTIEKYRSKLQYLWRKSGQISSDIRAAQSALSAFPSAKNKARLRRCFQEVDWHKERTDEMRELLGLPMQTKYLTNDQVADSAAEPERQTELNALELLYYADRQSGSWPFEQCFQDFGEGYFGWLRWKFENGLVTLDGYTMEKQRLAAL